MFNKIKDKGIEVAIKAIATPHLQGIGKIETVAINTKEKQITLSLNLEGENDRLVTIVVSKYEIITEGKEFQIVSCFSSDRPWLSTICERWINGLTLPIPPEASTVVKFLL